MRHPLVATSLRDHWHPYTEASGETDADTCGAYSVHFFGKLINRVLNPPCLAATTLCSALRTTSLIAASTSSPTPDALYMSLWALPRPLLAAPPADRRLCSRAPGMLAPLRAARPRGISWGLAKPSASFPPMPPLRSCFNSTIYRPRWIVGLQLGGNPKFRARVSVAIKHIRLC